MRFRSKLSIALAAALALVGAMAASAQAPAKPALIESHVIDLGAMKERRIVRVLVPFSKTIYFIDKGRQFGTAVEFGRELEKALNKDRKKQIDHINIVFVPMPRDRLLAALNEGLGDIVMANLTVTDERSKEVDFTDPLYSAAEEILVASPGSPPVASLDDLSGQHVAVRLSSSYHEHLLARNRELAAAGKPEIVIEPMDESLEDEDLMEMVNADLLPFIIVDAYKADIWSHVFPDIKVRHDIVLSSEGKIAWAIRKNSPQLKAELNGFVANHKVGSTFGNILRNSFYKQDKIVKRAYSPSDVERFQKLVEIFRKYGGTYSFDYLMLMAQGYQESQLDQSRHSPRGAVGIMQMLPSTARDKVIDISGIDKDPDRNVEAGAKYLRHLIATYIDDQSLTPKDRQLFAFAAYNAGPGNLRKFREKAKSMGLDPDIWFGNVENGAAAIVGRETVQYVSNIYKYYVAYSLLVDRMEKRKQVELPKR
ncbi:transporter substrate-binding domain-containing protein [Rhizobium sp. S152]|uniref:transglycosylase SLT domain-containing protein n=1 Tax=Rhizobium sp. S152 TaxID=3055038 RepID=UPI0025A96EF1|nr:transporter substrate-binding domain-containing protein [Rhizobium sp. S152]MDM9628183.1 transporter substrate-binding domain-containing protein [Rhizobium sp. S152]